MSNLSPKPYFPSAVKPNTQSAAKAATPDVILLDQETLPVDVVGVLTFQQAAATEIIQMARHDLVNGQIPDYGIIRGISEIESKNNSKNIINIPESSNVIFESFPINLLRYVPDKSLLPMGEVQSDSSGNILIFFNNLEEKYDVEVEVLSSGSLLDDTIYVGL